MSEMSEALRRPDPNCVSLEVIGWDNRGVTVAMAASLTPQEAIKKGLPQHGRGH
jgi:hypothetical protein